MEKESVLYKVVNVEEACRLFKKARKTIMNRLDKGHIEYRQCGRNWLITVESLEKIYGKLEAKNGEKP